MLPTYTEYLQSLSNPQICFTDSVLRDSQPVRNQRGQPFTYAGNIVLTAQMQDTTQRYWAVRCFMKPLPTDLEDRYAAISNFIAAQQSALLVSVQYQLKGILVNGSWYPICKMEWVSGQTLREHIQAIHQSEQDILLLAQRFRALVGELEKYGCAHGDLQHDNIMIVDDNLKLVDYDGMFVPQLSGRLATESGHRNYQHPQRQHDQRFFNAQLDRFSAISIYLSLQGLVTHGDQYNPKNEALLLQKSDYENPDSSHILSELERIEELRLAIFEFRRICQGGLEEVPSLEQFIETTRIRGYVPKFALPCLNALSNKSLKWHSPVPGIAALPLATINASILKHFPFITGVALLLVLIAFGGVLISLKANSPTELPQVMVMPSDTPTQVPTATATFTPSPTATKTPLPTATKTPLPTETDVPMPTDPPDPTELPPVLQSAMATAIKLGCTGYKISGANADNVTQSMTAAMKANDWKKAASSAYQLLECPNADGAFVITWGMYSLTMKDNQKPLINKQTAWGVFRTTWLAANKQAQRRTE